MVDREKVIKGLEHCTGFGGCYDCPYTDCDNCTPFCKAQLMRDALALLKAPQKPIAASIVDSDGGLMRWWACGLCKAPINPEDKYCHECGTEVKWNGR